MDVAGSSLRLLSSATLPEQNDEWTVRRRYVNLEALVPVSDIPTVSLPTIAARLRLAPRPGALTIPAPRPGT